jgi:hypothetical protein
VSDGIAGTGLSVSCQFKLATSDPAAIVIQEAIGFASSSDIRHEKLTLELGRFAWIPRGLKRILRGDLPWILRASPRAELAKSVSLFLFLQLLAFIYLARSISSVSNGRASERLSRMLGSAERITKS